MEPAPALAVAAAATAAITAAVAAAPPPRHSVPIDRGEMGPAAAAAAAAGSGGPTDLADGPAAETRGPPPAQRARPRNQPSPGQGQTRGRRAAPEQPPACLGRTPHPHSPATTLPQTPPAAIRILTFSSHKNPNLSLDWTPPPPQPPSSRFPRSHPSRSLAATPRGGVWRGRRSTEPEAIA